MTVLIIEDERKAANELQQLVTALRPGWKIIASIPSAEETINWLNENKHPDLIFSDIQLADADCFGIFEQVQVNCPIIFCTAYDEYAMKAFETNGIDYLLKPVDKVKLEKSLEKLDKLKAIFSAPPQNIYAGLGTLISQMNTSVNKTLLVNHKEKIIPVKYTDVAYFYYNQGVVMLRLQNNTAYYISITIDEVEAAADKQQFYRANRQFLINRNAIQDIERFFARKLVVKLVVDTPESIVVSKGKASDFLNWMEGV